VSEQTTIDLIDRHRKELLGELHRRQELVRDYVRAVARHWATGLYLFGRPGAAKPHTVKSVLNYDIKEPYGYHRPAAHRGNPAFAPGPQGGGTRDHPAHPSKARQAGGQGAGLERADRQVGAGLLPAAGRDAVTLLKSVNTSKCQSGNKHNGCPREDGVWRWPLGGGKTGGRGLNMLTPKQVAERLGISDSLVYEWCDSSLLPHYRFGGKGKRGRIMIDERDLDTFLASCRQEARPEVPAPPLKHIKLD
jgi:excisionase family DNA binding protein